MATGGRSRCPEGARIRPRTAVLASVMAVLRACAGPPLPERLAGRLGQIAARCPLRPRPGQCRDAVIGVREQSACAGGPFGQREAPRRTHHPGGGFHRQILAARDAAAFGVDLLGAQMDQDRRNVDTDRAGIEARAAQRGANGGGRSGSSWPAHAVSCGSRIARSVRDRPIRRRARQCVRTPGRR